MKRYKLKHPPIQTHLLLQYFVTNMHNTNLPGVNLRLVRILLFDNDQILLYNNESVVTNLIRFHVLSLSLSLYDLLHTDAERPSRSFLWWWTLATGVDPKACR